MIRESETPSLLQRRIYGTLGITLLVGLYLLVGLAGHDPWRGDDARHFGPILSMLQGEGWLFPMLAGEALPDYPPLYYWTGALLAWASSGFLALHEGARLASALFVALGVYFSARTAEALYGRPATVQEVIDATVGRILARLGFGNGLYPRWHGLPAAVDPPDEE